MRGKGREGEGEGRGKEGKGSCAPFLKFLDPPQTYVLTCLLVYRIDSDTLLDNDLWRNVITNAYKCICVQSVLSKQTVVYCLSKSIFSWIW